MRRLIAFTFGILLLAACGEMRDSTPVDVLPEDDPGLPKTSEIYDGASGTGGNEHFFFLSPVADKNPDYSGIHDDDLQPIVTVCYLDVPDPSDHSLNECSGEYFSFDMEDDGKGNRISLTPGSKYGVVWKTNDYEVDPVDQKYYRITVSVLLPPVPPSTEGEEFILGWADVRAYDNQTYSSFQHTDGEGFIAISDNGNLNINFRIEEGAVDDRFCPADENGFQDCDAELVYADQNESQCLEVFGQDEIHGETLGSEACVTPNAARDEKGKPVTGVYAVILTLELEDTSQPDGGVGGIAAGFQRPFFPDFSTFPDGLSFDRDVGGVNITICQVGEENLSEVRPFYVLTNEMTGGKQTIIPTDYEIVYDACGEEPVTEGTIAAASAPEGLMGYLAAGVSKVSELFRAKPLVARRLHGGLNTTVYNTRGDGGSGDATSSEFSTLGPEFKVEAGSVYKVFIENSGISEAYPGLMLSESLLLVTPRNIEGDIIPFDVTVEWWIGSYDGEESANPRGSADLPLTAKDLDGPDGNPDGVYEIRYTPDKPGTDYIYVKIDGEFLNGGVPFVHEVAPLTGTIEVAVQTYVEDGAPHAPAPADGIPVLLYAVEEDGSFSTDPDYPVEAVTESGVATFGDILFGRYVAYLPKRDFDVRYFDPSGTETHQQAFDHDSDPSQVIFRGLTTALPEGVEVFRIGEGGNGNAYQFVADNRSWVSAQNQIRDVTLSDGKVDVPAHLATIKSAGENGHIAGLVFAQCLDPSKPNRCSQAWIGLTDEEIDGQFKWVNDEGYLNPTDPSSPYPESAFWGWMIGDRTSEPSGKNNEDHVEIDLDGKWSDENGASSTNDGYITEYDVPDTPPVSPPGAAG